MSTALHSPRAATAPSWLERWRAAQAATDALFDRLRPEAVYARPIPERHRLIFYLGHLEAFDFNLLEPRLLRQSGLRPEWDKLFAFGIDPVGGGLPRDQPGDWPPLDEVRAYARETRARLEATFAAPPADDTLLHVALEHRWMHAETLAYLLHALPVELKHSGPAPQAGMAVVNPADAEPGNIRVPAGVATLGRERGGGFGWDNEFPALRVEVAAFSAARGKVSNGEYLEFVRAGGYRHSDFWSPADWEWRSASRIEHPHFWAGGPREWRFRGMFGETGLPLDWPVWVSHAEASAFARWAGAALPSEAQWHRLAYGEPGGGEREFPWGNAPAAAQGNFNLHGWDPEAVQARPEGASAWGALDLVGNGWEWTATPFAPFPGFERFEFYPGYSADFFDGRHFVLKGGSPRTHASLLRRSFRNWFQPHYPYLYSGFRCVKPV